MDKRKSAGGVAGAKEEMTEMHAKRSAASALEPVPAEVLKLVKEGWAAFPCRDKQPITGWKGGKRGSRDLEEIARWATRYPDCRWGATPPEGQWVLDVDPRNGGDETLRALAPRLPPTPKQKSGGGGVHYVFNSQAPSGKLGEGLDIKRGGKGYVIVAPSVHHETGGAYTWELPPWKCEPAAAPAALLGSAKSTDEEGTARSIPTPWAQVDKPALRAALGHLPADDYEQWIAVGMALHSTDSDEDGEAFAAWDTWSRKSAKYPGTEALLTKWRSFGQQDGTTVRTIFGLAKDAGWDGTVPPEKRFEPIVAEAEDDDDEADLLEQSRAPRLPAHAYPGVLAQAVALACENTEAVPASVAGAMLASFAARFGRALYFDVGDQRLSLNVYLLAVGPTGKGRKGTSDALPDRVWEHVDGDIRSFKFEDFLGQDMYLRLDAPVRMHGVASGEGIIDKIKDRYHEITGEPVLTDKRLLIKLPEFAQVLTVAARDGNTLSEVLRNGFDGLTLETGAKRTPIAATRPHVCLAGHITATEYVNKASQVDAANGLLNRFVTYYSVRSKIVPHPTRTPDAQVRELATRVTQNVFALFDGTGREVTIDTRHAVRIRLDKAAHALWSAEYPRLTTRRYSTETVGNLMQRAESNALRMAALVAAINGSAVITPQYLKAGIAWVEHAADVAEHVFSSFKARLAAKRKHDLADTILRHLRDLGGKDVPLKDLTYALKQRHVKASTQDRMAALQVLANGAPPQVRIATAPGKGTKPVTLLTVV
jgi:hypothetical protein